MGRTRLLRMNLALIWALTVVSGCVVPDKHSRVLDTATKSEVRLHSFRSWDTNCEALPVTITVLSQPTSGTIDIRDTTSKISAKKPKVGRGTQCAGKEVDSKAVYYMPNNGFRGIDIVLLAIDMRPGSWTAEYTVKVQ